MIDQKSESNRLIDLVQRLRNDKRLSTYIRSMHMKDGFDPSNITKVMDEAAAAIEAQAKRITELEAALKPFADLAFRTYFLVAHLRFGREGMTDDYVHPLSINGQLMKKDARIAELEAELRDSYSAHENRVLYLLKLINDISEQLSDYRKKLTNCKALLDSSDRAALEKKDG